MFYGNLVLPYSETDPCTWGQKNSVEPVGGFSNNCVEPVGFQVSGPLIVAPKAVSTSFGAHFDRFGAEIGPVLPIFCSKTAPLSVQKNGVEPVGIHEKE